VNSPLRKVSVAALVLFAALFLNLNYVQFVSAEKLAENQHNRRLVLDRYGRERGAILAGNQPIATVVERSGQYRFTRRYAEGPLYAHITGYYSLYYGSAGIENTYDGMLSGEDEALFVSRISDLITGREPAGAAVRLTLDHRLQTIANRQLGDRKGAIVAVHPKTGAVLAMVSKPTYDPNPITSISERTAKKGFADARETPGRALVNRTIADTFPPGSIFKVITSAAYFEQLDKTPDDLVESPPQLKLPLTTRFLRNFGGGTCGSDKITVEHALEISCNTAFANMGLQIGAARLRETAQGFGFNEPFDGFPLPTVPSVVEAGLDKPQTALSAIGQHEVRVTPLQMALVAAGIANRGVVMRPYLVDEVITKDRKVVESATPSRLRPEPAVSERTAELVSRIMQSVVRSGSGTRAQIPGVPVAGKTGTAQNAPGQPPHAWFIGFAPADDPQIAIAVFVEGGDGGSAEATGGVLAAPMAKAVMEAALGR